MTPDRRKPSNDHVRDRVDEIKQGVRYMKTAVWVTGVFCIAAIVITLRLNSDRVDQINQERYMNTLNSCNNTTTESKLGRALVIKVIPHAMQDPSTARLVRDRYPILSPEQCTVRARRLVPNAD